MVQRSRPSILLAALVLGVVVPFYFNLIDGNYECVGKVNGEQPRPDPTTVKAPLLSVA
eukprot:SAG31_NODE_298_length_18125_cov_27.373350_18_plen_58_part_00